jgi:hypothetical protein
MIQINDMFRLQQTKVLPLGYMIWHVEEWQPSPHSVAGRWHRVTDKLSHDAMDGLLERMQCPVKPREEFRAMM